MTPDGSMEAEFPGLPDQKQRDKSVSDEWKGR